MRIDHRIPKGPRRFAEDTWLIEVRESGEAVVVENMTYLQLNEWANHKFGLFGWELHDRQETGVFTEHGAA